MRVSKIIQVAGTAIPVRGNDIDTDQIIPARYMRTVTFEGLGKHAFNDLRFDDKGNKKGHVFNEEKYKGAAIMIVNKNFGCGSSREHAQISIKGAGISCVIAESFARIFLRNAINMGLPILEIKDISKIKEGDYLEVDLAAGAITDLTEHKEYKAKPLPKFIQEIIRSGGLLKWIKKAKDKGCRVKGGG